MNTPRGEHVVVYMHVISMVVVKGQNLLILICYRMKELTFANNCSRNGFSSLLFTGKKALLMKNLFYFVFSKMAAYRGISFFVFLGGRGYFGSLKWLVYG